MLPAFRATLLPLSFLSLMRFGICTTVENAPAVKAAGWDFVEERVDQLLQGMLADRDWRGAKRAKDAVLPIDAANVLVPAVLKITGPEGDPLGLNYYMKHVMQRAQKLGIKTLVFGSGGARNVPQGWDRDKARSQIVEFLQMI